MSVIDQMKHIQLFENFSHQDFEKIEVLSRKVEFPSGAALMNEGDKGFDFYVIVSGTVAVLKKSETGEHHQIRTLKADDTVGDIAFVEGGIRGATVKALEPVEAICIDGDRLRKPDQAELLAKLTTAIGKMLSQRLQFTNRVTVRSMEGELAAVRGQLAMGLMMTSIIFLTASYEFVLGLVLSFKDFLSSTTPISVLMIVGYALVLFFAVKRSGYPLASYGLTWERGWEHALKAIAYSLPVMLLVLLGKWILIHSVDDFAVHDLFQPFASLKGDVSLAAYGATAAAYALFCPVQEFIARGAIQSSLKMFLKKNHRHAVLVSIVLSNLIFASSHMHTNFWFALLAFVPGLYWGWLFDKQRSLVGVSVSHILIGLWVSFVVGLPGLT